MLMCVAVHGLHMLLAEGQGQHTFVQLVLLQRHRWETMPVVKQCRALRLLVVSRQQRCCATIAPGCFAVEVFPSLPEPLPHPRLSALLRMCGTAGGYITKSCD